MSVDFSKYGTPVAKTNGGLDFSKYGTPVETSQTQVSKTPNDGIRGGLVGRLLTSSTQKFGKTIGESIAAPGNADLYAQSLQSHTKIQNDLLKTIQEKKKLGQDTTRLEDALENHIETTPKLRDFTGDVIDKTAGQVIGEGIGTGLEALSGGSLSAVKEVIASKALSTLDKVREGAKIGAAYGGIGGASNAMQEGGGVGETLKQGVIGAGTGAVLGGGLGYGGAKLGQVLERRPINLAERKTAQASKVTGEILQGEASDVARGQQVLKDIDVSKIKTYDEGTKVLDQKVKDLSAKKGELLSTDTTTRKLGDLQTTIKVGDQELQHNYVDDALKQLDDFYTKTNNQVGKAEVAQLEAKATKSGLTVKEIDDLAVLHGKRLNAYNASGELASGLSKQAAENTRAGLKATAREFFGSEAPKAIDKEISDTIRVRDLFKDMSEKVTKLQQKIQTRSLGAKAGNLVGRVINTIGLGSPKGIVEALIPRGQGFKVMNALDLEKVLQKNLKFLQEITEKDLPENTLIKKLEGFFGNKLPEKPAQLSSDLSPAQKIKAPKISQNISKTLPRPKPRSKLPPKPKKLK